MPLVKLPKQDSSERAERCRVLLDIDHDLAFEVAHDTLRILADGGYTAPSGRWVDIVPALSQASGDTITLAPDEPLTTFMGWPRNTPAGGPTRTWVANVPTLVAARAFAERSKRPCVLNFANGTTPGGGFLIGARAQEESLCLASTLYFAIKDDEMYEFHRGTDPGSSSAHLIVSPTTVFRDESQNLIDTPWEMDVITCAAPICDRHGRYGRITPVQGAELMRERIERVLDVAAAMGATHLVLGAWGCGAFQNDPHLIAPIFGDALEARAHLFDEVVFAISDRSPERRFLSAFAARLSSP